MRLSHILIAGAVASATPVAPLPAQTVDHAPRPSLGKIVDIGGGQRLFLDCRGKGSPTVILEAGAGDLSFVWALVQDRVAEFTTVCSYDRGGYLWSDPGARPRTYAQLALELHTALDRAGVRQPYILVGQSYGGLVVRGFAKRYPRDVVGMVLVDAVHEDEHIVYGGAPHLLRAEAKGRPFPEPHIQRDTAFLRMSHDSAVLTSSDPLPAPLDRLPKDAREAWQWAQGQPLYRMTWAAEMDWSPEELARMHEERRANRRSLGSMALTVLARAQGGYDSGMTISADSLERERRALVAGLAKLSSRGEVIFAKSAGHNIHLEDPELVVRAIRSVVRGAEPR